MSPSGCVNDSENSTGFTTGGAVVVDVLVLVLVLLEVDDDVDDDEDVVVIAEGVAEKA
jgi:hypothetical protein